MFTALFPVGNVVVKLTFWPWAVMNVAFFVLRGCQCRGVHRRLHLRPRPNEPAHIDAQGHKPDEPDEPGREKWQSLPAFVSAAASAPKPALDRLHGVVPFRVGGGTSHPGGHMVWFVRTPGTGPGFTRGA
jgi:hypothetical protein